MHGMIESMLAWYFGVLNQMGLVGVVVLMAMESSIFPVPSEFVIPPAAVIYRGDAHQDGAMVLVMAVILAGALGSYLGSAITYWVARALGRPFIVRYGKYFFLPEKKLKQAEQWMVEYGAAGIFFARMLPVVRHIIAIPAGLGDLRFRTFSLMTLLGSTLWCTVLAIFGLMMAPQMQMLIAHFNGSGPAAEPADVQQAFHTLTLATVALVLLCGAVYYVILRRQHALARQRAASTDSPEA